MRRAYLLTMTATACAVALSLVIGLVAYGAPATARNHEDISPEVRCLIVEEHSVYDKADKALMAAERIYEKKPSKRHRSEFRAAIADVEKAWKKLEHGDSAWVPDRIVDGWKENCDDR